jgi:hypothetical protein
MVFNKSDLESLVNRTLVIECFEIALEQNTQQSQFNFYGPGSISMRSNGSLSLKMYDSSKKSSIGDIVRLFYDRSVGVVPAEEFHALTAKDANGNVWTSPKVYIRDGVRLTPHGAIVEIELPGIWSVKDIRHRSDLENRVYANILTVGSFNLPFNKFEDQLNGSSSVTAIDLDVGESKIGFSQKPTHLEIDIQGGLDVVDQNYIVTVAEALSIAIGKEAWPAYYRLYTADQIKSYVSGKVDVKGLVIMQPLVEVFPYKAEQFTVFLNAYINNRAKEHDHIINYWRRLYYVSSIISDVAALVLTVNIEGMIKNYFSAQRAPSDLLLLDIANCKDTLAKIKLPSSVEGRINNLLGNMRTLSPPNILRELVSEGMIEESQVKSWNALRHALAHAENLDFAPEATARFIENISRCLSLFYRLISLSVGYDASTIIDIEDSALSPDEK